MQKSLKITLSIGQTCFETVLTVTKQTHFDPSCFYDSYPHVFFSPKGENLDFFSSGAIFLDHSYPAVDCQEEIPLFILGDTHSEKWQDLGKCFGFIPKKWALTQDGTTFIYELKQKSISIELNKLPKSVLVTSEAKAVKDIKQILSLIQEKHLEKCVYGHITETPFHNQDLYLELKSHHYQGTKFLVRFKKDVSFFGISPEWLFKREDDQLFVDALAGTAKTDQINQLFESKIIDEFNFVKKDIQNSLHDLVQTGSFKEEDQIAEAYNLVHRHNVFEGILKKGILDSTLIHALHPTAAISGFPKKPAYLTSLSLETYPRGLFASPIGFYTQKKAYVAIAIRSGLILEDKAYLFSGAGIVQGSDPLSEWQELQNKLILAQSLINKS